MSDASRSQIVFARAIVRYALYQSVLNIIPVAWGISAFVIGIADVLYWPSLWGALAVYLGGALYLGLTILLPAIRTRIAEREREKG